MASNRFRSLMSNECTTRASFTAAWGSAITQHYGFAPAGFSRGSERGNAGGLGPRSGTAMAHRIETISASLLTCSLALGQRKGPEGPPFHAMPLARS